MVQLAPAARVAPQVPPERENGAVTTTVIPVGRAPPPLLSVSVCAALVVPCTTLVNVSEVGDTARDAFADTWNSTAPASTWLLVFLALPKKSRPGASVKAPVAPLAVDGM